MFRLWVSTIASWFERGSDDAVADSTTQIRTAIDLAMARDQDLRNQAARLIARKIVLGSHLGRAAEELGRSQQMARAAFRAARDAETAGPDEDSAGWAEAARGLALRSRAIEEEVARSVAEYQSAVTATDRALDALAENARRVGELATGPNRDAVAGTGYAAEIDLAVRELSTSIEDRSSDLEGIRQMIEKRKARAAADGQIEELSLDAALRKARETANMSAPGDGAGPEALGDGPGVQRREAKPHHSKRNR